MLSPIRHTHYLGHINLHDNTSQAEPVVDKFMFNLRYLFEKHHFRLVVSDWNKRVIYLRLCLNG